MARPSKYSDKLADEICIRIMQGESLRSICRDPKMPVLFTICRWLNDKERYGAFYEKYVSAREVQAEINADDIVEIADDASNDYMEKMNKNGELGYVYDRDSPNRSKLRMQARMWNAENLLPKRFGKKQIISGDENAPLKIVIEGKDAGL